MGRALATFAGVAVAAMLSGCMQHVHPRFERSLKDDAPKPVHTAVERPVAEERDGSIDRASLVDRAKAEQSARCGQRHIDHGKGILNETQEQKHVADAICGELHKYDYVR